jgi:hypothetical protein
MHDHSTTSPRRLDIEGWRGFPVPHLWDPFHPQLSVCLDLSRGDHVSRWWFDEFETRW